MKTLLAAKCRICNQQLGLHQQDTLKCPAYRDGFPAGYGDTVYEPKFFTASDIALAEERGRREVWAYVQSISALLPAGEEFWSEKRDVYIIDAAKFHALLAEKEAEE